MKPNAYGAEDDGMSSVPEDDEDIDDLDDYDDDDIEDEDYSEEED